MTPRCSEMPKVTRSQRKLNSRKFGHNQEHWSFETFNIFEVTTSFPTTSITENPTGTREIHCHPSQNHGFVQACPCAQSKRRALVTLPTLATFWESWTPRISDTTGSQELGHTRMLESQGQLDSQELWYTQDLRIPGSQNHRITAGLWGVLTQAGPQDKQVPIKDSKGR